MIAVAITVDAIVASSDMGARCDTGQAASDGDDLDELHSGGSFDETAD